MSSVRDRITEGLTRERLRLELRRARGPFAVWLGLVALGVVALVFLFTKLGVSGPWDSSPYRLRVAVDDAKGVLAGNSEVRISGLVVGRIDGVHLVHDAPVLDIEIKKRYAPLYRDARLRLRPRTPLEDMYLNVERRGTPAAGVLKDGALISADRTHTPVHIGRVLDVFDDDVRVRVKQAIDNMGRGLGDHGSDFREALVELAPFLRAARHFARENAIRQVETKRLVHNFALINEELARRSPQVTRLVTAGAGAFQELGAVDRQLSELFRELPSALRQMPETFGTLRSTADDLDPAFDAMRSVAHALPGGLRALERFGPQLETGSIALRRPIPRLTSLLRASGDLSNDLGPAFMHLRPAAPRLDRITAEVVPCELAVQKFFQWTLSILKFYDVRGVMPRGLDVAGTNSAGGRVQDPAIVAAPSCAKGGPRK